MAAKDTPARDGATEGLTESLGQLAQIRRQAEETHQAECQRLGEKYGLTADEAHEAIWAYDDMLHLGRHHSGRQRLAQMAGKVGGFLLDQFLASAPDACRLVYENRIEVDAALPDWAREAQLDRPVRELCEAFRDWVERG